MQSFVYEIARIDNATWLCYFCGGGKRFYRYHKFNQKYYLPIPFNTLSCCFQHEQVHLKLITGTFNIVIWAVLKPDGNSTLIVSTWLEPKDCELKDVVQLLFTILSNLNTWNLLFSTGRGTL